MFLRQQVNRSAEGPAIVLPDGSAVPRWPGYARWMWDGEFCGSIRFRWQPASAALPQTCLGHIGYSVVPWKRRRGYATRALRMLLTEIREEGLPYVELTTAVDNEPSRRVIEASGGVLVGVFNEPAEYGGKESLRYRIALPTEPRREQERPSPPSE